MLNIKLVHVSYLTTQIKVYLNEAKFAHSRGYSKASIQQMKWFYTVNKASPLRVHLLKSQNIELAQIKTVQRYRVFWLCGVEKNPNRLIKLHIVPHSSTLYHPKPS